MNIETLTAMGPVASSGGKAPPPVLLIALPGIPEVVAGDDLPALILRGVAAAGLVLARGDILVVTSKVVSKAGGRYAVSADRRAVVAEETVRVVSERMTTTGPTRIVEGRNGVVSAAAGVDASNTGPDEAILVLPVAPDAEAEALHTGLAVGVGHGDFGVLITDTAGRPWRAGQTDFALGAFGLRVLEDYRGRPDADGRQLDVTAIAVGDEVAAAADLVKGKVTRTPVALVRGLAHLVEPGAGVAGGPVAGVAGGPGAGVAGGPVAGVAGGPGAGAGEMTMADGAIGARGDAVVAPGSSAGLANAGPRPGASRLLRRGPGDFFAMGHVEAVRAALGVEPGSAGSEAVGIRSVGAEPPAERVARAVRLAALGLPGSIQWELDAAGPSARPDEPDEPDERGAHARRPAGAVAPGAPGLDEPAVVADEITCRLTLGGSQSRDDEFALGRLAARIEVALWSEGLTGRATRSGAGLAVRVTVR